NPLEPVKAPFLKQDHGFRLCGREKANPLEPVKTLFLKQDRGFWLYGREEMNPLESMETLFLTQDRGFWFLGTRKKRTHFGAQWWSWDWGLQSCGEPLPGHPSRGGRLTIRARTML